MDASANPYRDPRKYFEVLRATLAEVFGRSDAQKMVDGLATDVLFIKSDQERLLFFHSEPISTAEDMTGIRPTPAMYDRYLKLARQLGWNSEKPQLR